MVKLSRLLLFLILLAPAIQGKAQWRFIMELEVTDEGKDVSGAEIKVYRGGSLVETVLTDAKGRADIPMDPNGEYSIEVGGNKGLVKKIITVSTNNVPANTVKGDIFYPAEVELFSKIEDMNLDILNKPIGKIFFDPEYGDFGADRKYTKQVQKQLEDLKDDYLARKAKEESDLKDKKKEYDAAIKIADKAFQSEKWEEAEKAYLRASELLPLETYPSFQLAELKTKLIKLRENNKKYDEAIASADAAVSANELEKAIGLYQKASGYKPDEEYPKTKVSEIQSQLQNQAKAEQAYLAAIEKGDNALKANDFETAKKAFQEASVAKPTETYPKNKIAEIDDIIAKKQAKEGEYNQAIADGDQALKDKSYEQAKAAYQKASTLKPTEAYPKDQIAKVDGLLAADAKREQDYLAAIEKGDNALSANNLTEAKTAFESASSIKPEEDYPKNKIKEIDDLVASRAAKEKDYQDKIKAADQALADAKYDEAKKAYGEASGLKPTEAYPKDKIKEIDGILAAAAKKEEDYKKAIEKGDQALANEDFPTAKAAFNEALALKPDEQYPQDKLAEIETIVLKNQKQEEEYKTALQNGDDALADKNYPKAREFYNSALEIKANEQYPKDKIAEIDQIVQAAKELDENYLAAIKEGDDAYNNKELDKAKTAFDKASQLKPEEAYPKEQLAKIAAELADNKKMEEDYNKAIKEGDAAMASMNYTQAKTAFEAALSLKPDESYPAEKVKEIDGLLAAAAKKEEDYKKAIDEADKALAKEDWGAAKASYEAATKIKQNEEYPKNKIKEIDAKLEAIANEEAAAAKLEADYQAAIADGDQKLGENQLDDALSAFNKALALKPDESYPAGKVAEIKAEQERIAQEQSEAERLAALEAKYEKLIQKGDAAFDAGQLAEAKTSYEEALTVKAGESHPQDRINTINQKLAEADQLEQAYSDAIAKADELFQNKDYEKARAKYKEASAVKPSEQYPKDQLASIDETLANLAAQQEEIRLKQEKDAANQAKYDALIAQGDQLFDEKKYEEAKSNYESALAVKEESYPAQKIAEIEDLLTALAAEQAKEQAEAANESKYMAAITQADEMLASKRFEKAKAKYEEALTYKDDQYPKDQLKKVEEEIALKLKRDALAQQEARDQAEYIAVIQRADEEFSKEEFKTAKASYQAALKLKPNETYPVNKIDQINEILESLEISENAQRAIIESKYMESITLADISLDNEDYIDAREYYKNAIALKPNEEYPKKMLARIDAIKEDREREKEEAKLAKQRAAQNEASYQTAIANADNLFAEQKYGEAENEYNLALGLKPDEQYPKEQIDKITALLAEKNAAANREAQYKKYITQGNQDFAAKEYRSALKSFQGASKLKPEEEFPKAKIAELNQLLEAERLAAEEKRKELDKPIEIQTGPKKTISGDAEDEIERMYKEIWAKRNEEKGQLVEEKKERVKALQDANKEMDMENRKNAIQRIEDISITLHEQQKTADEFHLQNYEVVQETEKNLKETAMELNVNSERTRNNSYGDIKDFDANYKSFKQERNQALIEGKKEMVEGEYEAVKNTFKNYSDQQDGKIQEAKEANFAKETSLKEYNQELNEKTHEKNVGIVEERNAAIHAAEQERVKADQEEIALQLDNVNQVEENQREFTSSRKESFKDNQAAVEETTEKLKTEENNRVKEDMEAIADQQQKINQTEIGQKQFASSRKESFKDNQAAVEEKEKLLKEEAEELNAEGEKKRQEAMSREFYEGEDKPRQDQEAANFPQGVTEDIIENEGSTTIRRTVVNGTQVDVYEKTLYQYGEIFYSKNGTNITEETWDAESK